MSAEATIRFHAASKWYGPVLALSDVSFSVGPGVTGLLGRNGSGKSTMMRLACGLLRPGLGAVRVLGEDPARSARVRAALGLAPDVDRFYERLPARTMVAWMLRLSGFPRREAAERAGASLERMGLAGAMDRRIGGFSRGMRQRVKLALAVAHDPAVLLLDEPLNGLDPVGRHHVISLVRELGEAGRTVLVSSHVLHEVEAMTPSVLLLHQGRLLAEGTVREIRALMEDRPVRVRVACQEPRELARTLLGLEEVVSLKVAGAALEAEVRRPSGFFQRLTELGGDPRSGILEVQPLDESLEAVFEYLVR